MPEFCSILVIILITIKLITVIIAIGRMRFDGENWLKYLSNGTEIYIGTEYAWNKIDSNGILSIYLLSHREIRMVCVKGRADCRWAWNNSHAIINKSIDIDRNKVERTVMQCAWCSKPFATKLNDHSRNSRWRILTEAIRKCFFYRCIFTTTTVCRCIIMCLNVACENLLQFQSVRHSWHLLESCMQNKVNELFHFHHVGLCTEIYFRAWIDGSFLFLKIPSISIFPNFQPIFLFAVSRVSCGLY